MKNFTSEEFSSLMMKFKEKQISQKPTDLKTLFEKVREQLHERRTQTAVQPVEIQKPAFPTDTTVTPSILKQLKEHMTSNENE